MIAIILDKYYISSAFLDFSTFLYVISSIPWIYDAYQMISAVPVYGYKIQSQKQKVENDPKREALPIAGSKKSQPKSQGQSMLSLTQRYLLKIISLDHDRQCQVQNAFEHGYQYVYKLWPCSSAQREFVKIEMLQCVSGEMVKRGQASPLVRYSQQGDRFQFAGSKQEQCVLILKFRVSTLEQVEKQLSSRELERLNDQVELQLIKNKHENQNYHNYLEYTNRFLDCLDNGKYLDTPIQAESEVSLKSTQKITEQDKLHKQDSKLLGEFNSRMRESLKILSNGRYFAQSPSPTNNDREGRILPNIDEEENGNQSTHQKSIKRQDSQKISTEIRKRRNRYTIPTQESRQEFYIQPVLNKEKKNQHHSLMQQDIGSYKLPPPLQKQDQQTPLKIPDSPIIRTHEFPLKEEKTETEISRRNARRRKKGQSEYKQIKDSYVNALRRIQEVDLSKIFDRQRKDQKSDIRQNKDMKPVKEVKIQLFGLRLHLYKGDFELPKKFIITVGKTKYQTLPASIKNKYSEWTNRLVIPNINISTILHCKVVSVSEFSFFDEGDAKISVSELIRSDKKTRKIYLNDNKITIGLIQFQFNLYACDNEEQQSIIKHHGGQRKSVSLPQISNPIKTNQVGNIKERIGTASCHKKSYSKLKQVKPNDRYTTCPDQQQRQSQQLAQISNDKKSLLSHAKEKKMKMRAKIK